MNNNRFVDLTPEEIVTLVILGEAEGEDFIGKLAVACVVRNRRTDSRWPDDWTEVILQAKQFSCMNQFSRVDPIPDWVYSRWISRRNIVWWREARFAAHAVIYDWVSDQTRGANHYHAQDLVPIPSWAEGVNPCFLHGGHIFYRL